MNFSGSDLADYITNILDDLQHLESTDLVGLGFRILVLFFGVVFFVVFVKFLYRIFWDLFGGLIRGVWRIISAPYYVPKEKIRRYRQRRRWKKEEAIRQAQIAENDRLYQVQQQAQAEREQQERERFEEIMKQ